MTVLTGCLEESPLGRIWVAVGENGLVAVDLWDDEARFAAMVYKLTKEMPVYDVAGVTAVTLQLHEYFQQTRQVFDLPIDWSVMTPFQQTALHAVYAVPYGQVSTYGEIARRINKPTAVRAVGHANGSNPIPIIIPCHRILGSDGKLHGYGAPGSLETKAWLLRLEGSWLI